MVYRGKPSKACERCRGRRLRCDQQRPTCSSCARAGATCTGYRDTTNIRISDQTEFVRTKVLADVKPCRKRPGAGESGIKLKLKVCHLPQDLLIMGRDMFFTHYVSDFSRTWDFLHKYLDSAHAPKHVLLSIEAVSLAFLSHQVSSQTAKDLGRKKYCEALRKINMALQDPVTARATSTFEGALLLDLFEKITKSASEINTSRHAHIEGALALVKLRGVESFKEGSEMRALMGLSLNATVSSLSTGRAVDDVIREIRLHAAHFVNTDFPKWKLSGLMLQVTDLAAEMRRGCMTTEERIDKSAYLDRELELIALEASPVWKYERRDLSASDGTRLVPDGFPLVYDIYPDRMVTQMWNVLRIARMLLCEEIIASCAVSSDPKMDDQSERSRTALLNLVQEIVASVPQMTDCELVAKDKLPSESVGKQHIHSMPHIMDVYIMIFSLYVVAWSKSCPQAAVEWSIKQLRHIADHFVIKEAAVILEILKGQKMEEVTDPLCRVSGHISSVSGHFWMQSAPGHDTFTNCNHDTLPEESNHHISSGPYPDTTTTSPLIAGLPPGWHVGS
ncbi:hypothetical protein ACET3X_008123 [Alternaria dauci]|uniref:Zn(2)-C6 fungal-type domain-containing protein n=1 Tax=Alternaria dauci TaxID=48095 RepID=A0ABR3U9H8_9PLEO